MKRIIALVGVILLLSLAGFLYLFQATEVEAEGIIRTNPIVEMGWSGAYDNVSGLDGYSIEWSLNAPIQPDAVKDLEEDVETATSTSLEDGVWYFNLRTKDNAGNWSEGVNYGPIVIDTQAPVVTITRNPEIYDGENGWFVSELRMQLTASEGSTMYYSWDNIDFTQYEVPVTVPEGIKTLYVYAVDSAGNQSATDSVTIKVDVSSPFDPFLRVIN